MVLFQIWPLLTLLLLLILGWQLYRFVRSIFRKLQLKLDPTRLQLYKEWEVMEAQRTRIANDLHDDLGPLLSALGMRMNCLHPASDTDQQHFNTMRKYLDEVIERLGIISHNLTPLALSQKGLQSAIQEFLPAMMEWRV